MQICFITLEQPNYLLNSIQSAVVVLNVLSYYQKEKQINIKFPKNIVPKMSNYCSKKATSTISNL